MTGHHSSSAVPHGVPPRRSSGNLLFATSKQCFLVLATAIPSFLLGTTVALYARLDTASPSSAATACADLESVLQARVAQAVAAEKHLWMQECQTTPQKPAPARIATADTASQILLNKAQVGNYVTSMAVTVFGRIGNIEDCLIRRPGKRIQLAFRLRNVPDVERSWRSPG